MNAIPNRDYLLIGRPMFQIIAEVAEKHGLEYRELVSHRRDRRSAWPRQEAYWRCYRETDASLPEIGRAFGGRGHHTVMYGIKKHEERLRGNNG